MKSVSTPIAILTSTLLCLLLSGAVTAQQADIGQESLAGSWAGTLVIGRDSFDMTFNLTRDEDSFNAALISRQLGIYGMPAESVVLKNNRITIRLEILAAEYTGRLKMDESGSEIAFIDGEWFQEGEMVPVILRPAESQ
ncbi:MAG: hypothetical protein R3F41_06205 [Gammaproteobacteria bacterium]|nr:hypothetical protein [Pseudomonadales bacterium]MCP5348508.1 hypothetical protein [Pseudomonadales bacterium]